MSSDNKEREENLLLLRLIHKRLLGAKTVEEGKMSVLHELRSLDGMLDEAVAKYGSDDVVESDAKSGDGNANASKT